MRSVLVLCALAFALAAAEIKISFFNTSNCTGAKTQVVNITERKCTFGNDMFSCHSNPFTMCFDVAEYNASDRTCNANGLIGNVSGICGQCHGNMRPTHNGTNWTKVYSIVNGCSRGAKHLSYSSHCNPTCTHCKVTHPVRLGDCVHPHNAYPKTPFYKFLGVRHCPTTVTYRQYASNATCTGKLEQFQNFPAATCFPQRNSTSLIYQCV